MDSQYWFPVVTLLIGAAVAYVFESRRDNRTHERTLELTERQFEQATQRAERLHEQQIEHSGRQWRREKAFELLVTFNDLQGTAMDLVRMSERGYQNTGLWQGQDRDQTALLVKKVISEGIYCESLVNLIEDESLANDAREVSMKIVAISQARNSDEIEAAHMSTLTALGPVIVRLAAYARSL